MDTEPEDITPAEEPKEEVCDTHTGPLENEDDARFLPLNDSRRLAIERRLGKKFSNDPMPQITAQDPKDLIGE